MRTDLKAGLLSVLQSGGSLYSMGIIYDSEGSTTYTAWKVFGTLRTWGGSVATSSKLTNLLRNISDIDQSVDIFDSAMAKTPQVRIEFGDMNNTVDMSSVIGKFVEIRMGYGDTMSLETSDVFFSGTVTNIKSTSGKITLTCQGKGQLRNKEIGTKLPSDVDEKYTGKIYPILYGDWTDDRAFAPIVLNRKSNSIPDICIDENPIKEFTSLEVYDKDGATSYRAKSSGSNFITVSTGNNTIQTVKDISSTLQESIGFSDVVIKTDTNSLYLEFSKLFGAKALIVRIDNELMFVYDSVYLPDGKTYCTVKRAYIGTIADIHSSGSSVYVVSDDVSTLRVLVSNIFWVNGVSGIRSLLNIAWTGWSGRSPLQGIRVYSNRFLYDSSPVFGTIENMIDSDSDTECTFEGNNTKDNTAYRSDAMNILFDRPGISGEVESAYFIGKISMSEIYYVREDGLIFVQTNYAGNKAQLIGETCTSNGSSFTVVTCQSNTASGTVDFFLRRVSGTTLPSSILVFIIGIIVINIVIVERQYEGAECIAYISKSSTSNYMEILRATGSVSGVQVDTEFNNVDGSDDETALQLTGTVLPDDVQDIEDFAIQFNCSSRILNGSARGFLSIYKIGIRIDFYVSPIEYDFFVKVKGRVNPGGYLNGTVGDLIENPVSVIEDFCRQEVSGMTVTNLDQTAFKNYYTSRATWKIAASISAED